MYEQVFWVICLLNCLHNLKYLASSLVSHACALLLKCVYALHFYILCVKVSIVCLSECAQSTHMNTCTHADPMTSTQTHKQHYTEVHTTNIYSRTSYIPVHIYGTRGYGQHTPHWPLPVHSGIWWHHPAQTLLCSAPNVIRIPHASHLGLSYVLLKSFHVPRSCHFLAWCQRCPGHSFWGLGIWEWRSVLCYIVGGQVGAYTLHCFNIVLLMCGPAAEQAASGHEHGCIYKIFDHITRGTTPVAKMVCVYMYMYMCVYVHACTFFSEPDCTALICGSQCACMWHVVESESDLLLLHYTSYTS